MSGDVAEDHREGRGRRGRRSKRTTASTSRSSRNDAARQSRPPHRGGTGARVRAGRPLLVGDEQRDELAGTSLVVDDDLPGAGTSLLADDDCRRERARARRCGGSARRPRGVRLKHDDGAGRGAPASRVGDKQARARRLGSLHV